MIGFVNKYIIGGLTPAALLLCGLFFCFRLKGFHFRHPLRTLLYPFRGREHTKKGETSPLSALCMALAGTLGTGNIVGVALALIGGGPGALLWMWICAALAAVVKYAEIVLALDSRRLSADGHYLGGGMYYIEGRSFFSKTAAVIFAALSVLNTLTLGSGVQAASAAEAATQLTDVPGWTVGLILAVITGAVIFRGRRMIGLVTDRLVPLMTLAYVIMSLAAIFLHRDALPQVMGEIFSSALHPGAPISGFMGLLLSPALRYGVSKGLLSNEAGCGTAPTAHASSAESEPARQGVFGMIEVSVDTLLLCTLTGLVILTSGAALEGGGVSLTLSAFASTFGRAAPPLLGGMIFVFAYATMLCQAFYGKVALEYLGVGKVGRLIHRSVFCLSALLFAILPSGAVWEAADIVLGLMTLINVSALFVRHRRVEELSTDIIQPTK